MGAAYLVLFGPILCLLLMVRVRGDEEAFVRRDGVDGEHRNRRSSGGCTRTVMEQNRNGEVEGGEDSDA